MPIQCRIIILSKTENFEPVAGLENFESNPMMSKTRKGGVTYVNAPTQPEVKVKPQPETWV